MPFDGTNFPELREPSFAALSYALRHPETWPPGFRWNYWTVYGCAIGLAESLWPCSGIGYRLPPSVYCGATVRGWRFWCLLRLAVRPEHVAYALDKWRATLPASASASLPAVRWVQGRRGA